MEFQAVEASVVRDPKFAFLITRIKEIKNRTALLDMFTIHQRPALSIPQDLKGTPVIALTGVPDEIDVLKEYFTIHVPKEDVQVPELEITDPTSSTYVYGLVPTQNSDKTIFLYKLADSAEYAPFDMGDQFYIANGMIANYTGEKMKTDVGKFLVNQLIIVNTFGDRVPYINTTIDPGKLDKILAKMILNKEAGRKEYNTYMNYGSWFGMDGSIATASWSEKTLTTDPKAIERKKELLQQYKDSLDKPEVLASIEAEIQAMDKAWIKGDPAEPFFFATKTNMEQRKKQYLTLGLSEEFGKETGKYNFVANSLEEGWTIDTLDVGANEVRKGSYGRGIETAKGGEQTKFIMRIFQEVKIWSDDCGSKRGVNILLSEFNYKYYLNRWTVSNQLIDEDFARAHFGQVVEIRSPQYCAEKKGFCFKCCGEIFRKLGLKAIGLNELLVTSKFTSTAMATMHVSGMSTYKVTNFTRFLR